MYFGPPSRTLCGTPWLPLHVLCAPHLALYIRSPNYTPSRHRVTETPSLAASGGAGRGVSVMPDRAPAARAGVSVAFPPRTAEFRQLWADRPISDDRNSASRATPCRESQSFGHARATRCREHGSFGGPRGLSDSSPSAPSPSGFRRRPDGLSVRALGAPKARPVGARGWGTS